jgi:glycosyltransferase involved in cell wall biosynthesis
MKVLISAYACQPGKGSEPGVGWNWAVQAARSHEVWVITRKANQHAIEATPAASANANLNFIYHDLPRPWSSLLKHRDSGGYLHYYAWQASALSVARELHAQIGFDVAQHITYAGFRFPSFLVALGVPYVWGPVGGAARAPLRFLPGFGWKNAAGQVARAGSTLLAKLDPLLWLTASRASLIVVDSAATRSALPAGAAHKTVIESQDALSPDEVPPRAQSTRPGLKMAYLGRLLYWKGLHLGIEALALARKARDDISLTVVATGPEEQRLRSLSARLGVAGAVHFTGDVSRQSALQLLTEQDCLLLPSFQDSGGPFAVLEAMAAGMPVICLGVGGPASSVTAETGVLIEPCSPSQVVRDLADAMLGLAADPGLRQRMGEAAHRRFQDRYVWDHKADVINSLYTQAKGPAPANEPVPAQ